MLSRSPALLSRMTPVDCCREPTLPTPLNKDVGAFVGDMHAPLRSVSDQSKEVVSEIAPVRNVASFSISKVSIDDNRPSDVFPGAPKRPLTLSTCVVYSPPQELSRDGSHPQKMLFSPKTDSKPRPTLSVQ